MLNHKKMNVIVVGAGVVGLTAAIAMRQKGFAVTVLDAGAMAPPSSRVYAINPASEKLLSRLGVWDLMDPSELSAYHHMYVWDDNSKASIEFDARMIGEGRLGFMLSESLIKRALMQRADALGVDIQTQHVSRVRTMADGIQVMNDEQTWSAELLVVADGAKSPIREQLRVPMTTWSYHQHAITATIRTEKKHQRTAYQVFRKQGPLAFLPLINEYESSIVWSVSPERAKHLMALPVEQFNLELNAAFSEKLGRVELISERQQFPLHMRHVKRYSGTHWIMMGDAAHTIHPLAGLGLNIGLADVSAWLECIDNDKFPIWSTRYLNHYQRHRKHALWQVIALMQGLHVLFTSSLPPLMVLRGLGLNLCNRLLPLKRLIIEHASGTNIYA